MKTLAIILAIFSSFAAVPTQASPDETQQFEVTFVSPVPDPETADYIDCLFVVKAKLLSDGLAADEEILISLWAFQERTLSDLVGIKVGDKFCGKLVPMEKTSASIQSTMVSDETYEFDLPLYFVESAKICAVKE
jgi:hypothetical protein